MTVYRDIDGDAYWQRREGIDGRYHDPILLGLLLDDHRRNGEALAEQAAAREAAEAVPEAHPGAI